MLEARPAVRTLPAYHPPLGGRKGLRLDFNENTVGCSPRVLARLREITAEEIACYPERAPVEAAVAQHLDIKQEELLLTNGVDEAIQLLCQTFLQTGDEVLIVVPTFAMYQIFAAATGAQVITVPATDFSRFPTADLISRITSNTRLIAIANPNNPTGCVALPEDLIEIACRAPQAALMVDEAYFEFYGETLLRQSRRIPNLFVARTFSKAYGLAGLRIGVLAGNAEHIQMVSKLTSPYNVNGVALACLPAALADDEYIRRYVGQVREGRDELQKEFDQWGIRCWPSQANFVLASFGAMKDAVIHSMRARRILLRDRSSDYGCEGCVRITLGSAEQNARLIRTLREALTEIGAKEVTAR
jgi:histidinol-phosphate aminotransferase